MSEGEILFEGKDLVKFEEKEMEKVRGNDISMIFQEPMTSLNPVFTIGDQIMEAILFHQGVHKAEARRKAIEMLGRVKIPVSGDPDRCLSSSVERGNEAEGHDCHGSLVSAEASHRG